MRSPTGVGLAVRMLREREGLSLTELAIRAGVHKSNLSRVENDQRPLSRTMAKKLAAVLPGVEEVWRQGQLALEFDVEGAVPRDVEELLAYLYRAAHDRREVIVFRIPGAWIVRTREVGAVAATG